MATSSGGITSTLTAAPGGEGCPTAGKDKSKRNRLKAEAEAAGMSYTAYCKELKARKTAKPLVLSKNGRKKARLRAEAEEAGVPFEEYREWFYARKKDGQRRARHDEDTETVKGSLQA